jgi:hypothetical protein
MSRSPSIILVLVVLVAAGTSHACTCITPTIYEAIDRADSIFLGTVVSVATLDGYKLVSLDVERSWMGSHWNEARIVTELEGGMCGVDFRVGESWVVFASDTDWPSAEWSYTHLCTLNAPENTPYGQEIIWSLDAIPVEGTAWGTLKARFR